jgi:hypothetical protein
VPLLFLLNKRPTKIKRVPVVVLVVVVVVVVVVVTITTTTTTTTTKILKALDRFKEQKADSFPHCRGSLSQTSSLTLV